MSAVRRFCLRLLHALRPNAAEAELEREIRAHLGVIEDDHRASGMSGEEARRAARRVLGGVALMKERHRDARAFMWADNLRQDVRIALRSLVRVPGFAVMVIGTLALGIGVTTTIVSVVNTVLVQPLPYEDANRLVRIVEQSPPGDGLGAAVERIELNEEWFLEWRARTKTLSATRGSSEEEPGYPSSYCGRTECRSVEEAQCRLAH